MIPNRTPLLVNLIEARDLTSNELSRAVSNKREEISDATYFKKPPEEIARLKKELDQLEKQLKTRQDSEEDRARASDTQTRRDFEARSAGYGTWWHHNR